METTTENRSQVVSFYEDKTVFLTGATGFLGKLFIEKLLRVCRVKQVCCLVRSKKGLSNEERFEAIFENACFDSLKKQDAQFRSKIKLMPGDCAFPNLGLHETDQNYLTKNVQIIVHCAATLRFVEDIPTAFYINCRATKDLVRLAKKMPNLAALVYVSTAFSNCPRSYIKETLYTPVVSPEHIMNIVENMDKKIITELTPTLLGEWPNTYVFTKALAEDIVNAEGQGLPISIVRPSIIVSTDKEPMSGWLDNFFGPTGLVLGVAMGFLRVVYVRAEKKADLVPADYVINNCLAAAWEAGTRKAAEVSVYNFTCPAENTITWGKLIAVVDSELRKIPSTKPLWHAWYIITRNNYSTLVFSIFLHFLPAIVVDNVLRCMGKKPLLWKAYSKLFRLQNVITYFSTREWTFDNGNVRALWSKMSARDKELFFFDTSRIKWEKFMKAAAIGGRVYLLNDPLETVPEGRKKYKQLQIANYVLLAVLALIAIKVVCSLFNVLL